MLATVTLSSIRSQQSYSNTRILKQSHKQKNRYSHNTVRIESESSSSNRKFNLTARRRLPAGPRSGKSVRGSVGRFPWEAEKSATVPGNPFVPRDRRFKAAIFLSASDEARARANKVTRASFEVGLLRRCNSSPRRGRRPAPPRPPSPLPQRFFYFPRFFFLPFFPPVLLFLARAPSENKRAA